MTILLKVYLYLPPLGIFVFTNKKIGALRKKLGEFLAKIKKVGALRRWEEGASYSPHPDWTLILGHIFNRKSIRYLDNLSQMTHNRKISFCIPTIFWIFSVVQ